MLINCSKTLPTNLTQLHLVNPTQEAYYDPSMVSRTRSYQLYSIFPVKTLEFMAGFYTVFPCLFLFYKLNYLTDTVCSLIHSLLSPKASSSTASPSQNGSTKPSETRISTSKPVWQCTKVQIFFLLSFTVAAANMSSIGQVWDHGGGGNSFQDGADECVPCCRPVGWHQEESQVGMTLSFFIFLSMWCNQSLPLCSTGF